MASTDVAGADIGRGHTGVASDNRDIPSELGFLANFSPNVGSGPVPDCARI